MQHMQNFFLVAVETHFQSGSDYIVQARCRKKNKKRV